MAMFGNPPFGNPQFGIAAPDLGQGAPSMPAPAPTPTPTPTPQARPSFFGEGGVGRGIAGSIGDALLVASGHNPIYAPIAAQRSKQVGELQRQLQLQQYKLQNPEEPAIIRSLRAAGIDPASPQGQKLVQQNIVAPHYLTLGNPETGQQVIDPSAMAGGTSAPQAPPPDAIAHLRSNPTLSAQFDEMFGQGAAQRALSGN